MFDLYNFVYGVLPIAGFGLSCAVPDYARGWDAISVHLQH